jgi:hypothetical protein
MDDNRTPFLRKPQVAEIQAWLLSGLSGCMIFDHIFQKRARLSTTFSVGLLEMAE